MTDFDSNLKRWSIVKDNRKQKLIDLGPDPLADALLQLAEQSDIADDLIDHMIATPVENVHRFKKKLSSLKQSNRIIGWRGAPRFARELEALLQDLRSGITDPLTGVELVAAFYESDSGAFETCDDSGGDIGDVFRYSARELFVEFASRCTDKEKVADIILKVNRSDDYGVRDTLVDCASECLPAPLIHKMVGKLQELADEEDDERGRRHHLLLVESLARQIKDARLFEVTRIASWGTPSTAACIDIAQVYLECEEVEAAHTWLQKIPKGETFMNSKREELLLVIYRKQGDNDKLTELLRRKFRAHHSTQTLDDLLGVVGSDKRDDVISEAVALILERSELYTPDADFMISIGMIDQAEAYMLTRADQLDGGFYGGLLSLAEVMESKNRYLVTSLIYRSLLISILKRGYIKAYPHGVRYLKKLDNLAALTTDWKTFTDHGVFKDEIRLAHGRKKSFWSKYR